MNYYASSNKKKVMNVNLFTYKYFLIPYLNCNEKNAGTIPLENKTDNKERQKNS